MRFLPLGLLTAALASPATPARDPMPPNTIPLSTMMRELSAQPGFTEAFLHEVEGNNGHNRGAAIMTPALVDDLRKILLGKDWQRLDHFPGWTMGQINPTVRVVGHVAGHDSKVQSTATAGGAPGGKPSVPAVKDPTPTVQTRNQFLESFLDVGSYHLESGGTVDLSEPPTGKPFITSDFVSSLGDQVTRGDGGSPLAANHAASTRLSQVLNRLSMNQWRAGVAGNSADPSAHEGLPGRFYVTLGGHRSDTPEGLVQALLATGHTVTVADSRYFANFGHLHYKGQDVMMPFYVNPLIQIPGTGRPLLVPVSHAEYEWRVRGPVVNADVSFYFGIDGHAEFRTMDQLDQAWVMNRHAWEYTGPDALEVTRLNGLIVQAYERLHLANPTLPFGGYYGLGVCQDVVAAVELKLHGTTTLFPNTADGSFFNDPADAEINSLIRRLPKDRNGRPPEVERIFGSLPVGSSDAELATVTIPGLGANLIAVHDAWTNGTLKRIRPTHHLRDALYAAGALLLAGVLFWLRRTRRDADKKDSTGQES